ncbi:hypothetical protein [Marinobacterium aestuariivivens]|uniref:Reverse transcriptase domain-containing protein n=1 Tax=Marinobacterium aestuariivivens TaxID=1698799 RepID=A0ABW2AA19_9GAMM
MWGSVTGDIVGSIYEHADLRGHNLPPLSKISRFTDDTVLTVATAETLLKGSHDYAKHYLRWGFAIRQALKMGCPDA